MYLTNRDREPRENLLRNYIILTHFYIFNIQTEEHCERVEAEHWWHLTIYC